MLKSYASVAELLRSENTEQPWYVFYPGEYEANARQFVANFPGRVLYAVKANSHPDVLACLNNAGVRHFDCASLPEVDTVISVCRDARCYFMTPVRLRGAARVAQEKYGVRHFMIDHPSGLAPLAAEIDSASSVIFVRMAVSHPSAMQDLSQRFGAPPGDIPSLLQAVADTGAEPALAFNVGSSVTSPDAYSYAINVAKEVLASLPFDIRLIDIGGGFPKSYPGFEVPPLDQYFAAIEKSVSELRVAKNAEFMVEPGRALAAPGMSAVVGVLLRKEDRLFLNDGMHGIFWELRFKGHDRFPVRAYRNGNLHEGSCETFRLFGPTCDSTDELPGSVQLPADIRPGDHLEFGCIGAYSLTGRTNFNGFRSEQLATITDDRPPVTAAHSG